MAAAAAAATAATEASSSSSLPFTFVFVGHIDSGKTQLVRALALPDEQRRKQQPAPAHNYNTSYDKLLHHAHLSVKSISMAPEFYSSPSDVGRFDLIAAPGHRDFIKQACRCMAGADAGVLVVDASSHAFDAGMSRSGQTREHSTLLFTFGVKRLIVAVNKMDDPSVNYSKQRFEAIKSEVETHLKRIGFDIQKNVVFVPVSALADIHVVRREKSRQGPSAAVSETTGEGGTAAAEHTVTAEENPMAWADEIPCLAEQMNYFLADQRSGDRKQMSVVRDANAPLRLAIITSFSCSPEKSSSVSSSSSSSSSSVLICKVLAGKLNTGEQLSVCCTGVESLFVCRAEELSIRHKTVASSVAGDLVGVKVTTTDSSFLQNRHKQFQHTMKTLKHQKKFKVSATRLAAVALPYGLHGAAGSLHKRPILPAARILCQVIVLHLPGKPIDDGFEPVVQCGADRCACRVRVLAKLDRRTGRPVELFVTAEEAQQSPLKETLGDAAALQPSTATKHLLRQNDAAVMELVPRDPCFCVEPFVSPALASHNAASKLGRLAFFQNRTMFAVAVVKHVFFAQDVEPLYKWICRRPALLIRFKAREGSSWHRCFSVWNIMTTTALFLA